MKITTIQALIPNPDMVPTMQPVRKRFFLIFLKLISRLALASILMSGLLSCSNVNEYGMNAIGVNVTAINELTPQNKDNKDPVYVSGKVERKVPLLEKQMYQIEDSTGKIWVLTNQKNWKVGDKVVVKAIPQYESIPISGAELGQVYLEEK
ncbi:hypothetical protein [Calothrix sp. CCY 0018]|uniref:hypothetical protein n=1 Tax=Calothrix sp. CCY 0018 TaxID=3103864 RepID=UPI0039C63C50